MRPHLLESVPQSSREAVLARGNQGEVCEVHHILFEILRGFSPGGLMDKRKAEWRADGRVDGRASILNNLK